MKSFKQWHVSALLACMIAVPVAGFASDTTSTGILSTIVTIDQNEILAAVQAINSSADSDVNDFAHMMLTEHGKNLTEALALANKIKALPLNANPNDMHVKGNKELVTLGALKDKDYEKAYVEAMVTGHAEALTLINDKFLKSAKNEELKAFLTDTQKAVAQHLEDAKKLQATLKV